MPFRSLLLCCVNLRRPQNRVPQFPVPLGTNSSAQSQGGSQASYGAGPERSERWTRCSESGRRRPAPRRRVTGHHGDWWGQNAERVFALRLSQTPPGLLSDRWGPSWDFGADTSLRSLWRSLGALGEAPGVPAEDGHRATATFEPVRGPQGEPVLPLQHGHVSARGEDARPEATLRLSPRARPRGPLRSAQAGHVC